MPHPAAPRAFAAALVLLLTALAALLPLQGAAPRLDPCSVEGQAGEAPDFGNCADCHVDREVNAGDGSFVLAGVPSAWTAGTTYRLVATLADPGQQLWGFRTTAILADGSDAGLLAPADGNTAPCVRDGRLYLRNTNAGLRAGLPDGPVDFAFDWTAPAAGAGSARFSAVGFAGDLDGTRAGDYTYTAASVAVEDHAGAPAWSLLLQPDHGDARRGSTWNVRARLRRHGAGSGQALLVSRVRLPNGGLFPGSGWLHGPLGVVLASGEQETLNLVHAVPLSAPRISARYEAFLGAAPVTLFAADAFDFAVVD